jgi:hypothetical protein
MAHAKTNERHADGEQSNPLELDEATHLTSVLYPFSCGRPFSS